MKSFVCAGFVLSILPACVSEPSSPVSTGPSDVPVFEGDGEFDDPGGLSDPAPEDVTPAAFFEIAFIDRDGPVVADPADPSIPIGDNFVVMLRTDDGTTRRATNDQMSAQSVRFVPLLDPADPGPGDGHAVLYDALPMLAGRAATGAFALTDLDVELDNSMTPLLALAAPDNVDIDPTGQRMIACGVNLSPCICCGVRAPAKLMSIAGGVDQALEDGLNAALAMQLMTGATECQFGMDGNVIYAAGKDMDGNNALVRAMIAADGTVMAEPVAAAGAQGVASFDLSPDGMKIVFLNPLGDGGGVTVRDLSGGMVPITLSEATEDGGEAWAARVMHKSPRWCDDTHVAWETFDGTQRTIFLADIMTGERVDVWSDENRVPLSESWLDCRPRQE